MRVASEPELAGLARALGAATAGDPTPPEKALLRRAIAPADALVVHARQRIDAGHDPLGDAFCQLRTAGERRPHGATYTPLPIVRSMLEWAHASGEPVRVVDPGAGSGRFIVGAGRLFRRARLVAVEVDPLAALLARAHLVVAGLAGRAEVRLEDYRAMHLPAVAGTTLFAGNPPYVRHHDIPPRWKRWLSETAARHGLPASQLAGLHVHFFLATLGHVRAGDYGAFITAAEWLDVNYGALVRELLLGGLGGTALHVIEPTASPFPDAASTAVISCFQVGRPGKTIALRRVASLAELGALDRGRPTRVSRMAATGRWTPLTRSPRRATPGLVELGELCRVRRGQVTGANRFWIASEHSVDLPRAVLRPTITRARELLGAGNCLRSSQHLRRVIDLPEDLGALTASERRVVEAFLRLGRAGGVDRGYIASHRHAWWSVSLYEPAPVLATYMARRPPAFVVNLAGARHINIAHGLYPRVPMSADQLDALVRHLSTTTSVTDGRTYAGGLTKFEPREMERLLVPTPEALASA